MINNKQHSSKARKRLIVAIHSIVFVVKLRGSVFRLKRKKQLIKEWIDLQNSNVTNIKKVENFILKESTLQGKSTILLAGVKEIQEQSLVLITRLQKFLIEEGRLIFGQRICEICNSYSVYKQCLKTLVEKKAILQELSQKKSKSFSKNSYTGINIEDMNDYIQKLVFRSYQVALIVKQYMKYLPFNHVDKKYFTQGLDILTVMNKKYDQIIKQCQREQQVIRIEKILGEKITSDLLFSRKCMDQDRQIVLHVFDDMLIIQGSSSKANEIKLDKFSNAFYKKVEENHLVCVIAAMQSYYFFFQFESQVKSFVKMLRKLIARLSLSDSIFSYSQLSEETAPFVLIKAFDYRTQVSIKGGKRKQIVFNFGCLKQNLIFETRQSRQNASQSIRQSQLKWSQQILQDRDQQLNETVKFSLDELEDIEAAVQQNYCLKGRTMMSKGNFNQKLTNKQMIMLQWEAYFNSIFRHKNIIKNPIWLMKKLKLSEVIYESVIAQQDIELSNSQLVHCHLCANISIPNMDQYISKRITCLNSKYGDKKKKYCSNIFNKLKEEITDIPREILSGVQQLYIWKQFKTGQIDYAFHKRIESQKEYEINVMIPSIEQLLISIKINKYTLVSEALDDISHKINLPILVGYRLFLSLGGQQQLLRSNELLLPIVLEYNIRHTKNQPKSFISKLKSIGNYLEFFDQGEIILKKIIYLPGIKTENEISRAWQLQDIKFQIKNDKLFGLAKEQIIQLVVVFFLLESKNHVEPLPAKLKCFNVEKYLPGSIDEENQRFKDFLEKSYSKYLQKSTKDHMECIFELASRSPAFQRYILEMDIVQASQSSGEGKKISRALIAIGWRGFSVLTLSSKIVLDETWEELQINLVAKGLQVMKNNISMVFNGCQIFEISELCNEYTRLTLQSKKIKV